MRRSTFIARAGVIAAVYAALTVMTLQLPSQLGWGLVQFRLSEAVTVLATLTPAAIPGLWLGAAVANLVVFTQVGPFALFDVVFGSIASLLAAAWSWRFRSRTGIALLGPVIVNALIVPAYLPILLEGLGLYEVPLLGLDFEGHWLSMYLFGVVAIALSQAVVVYGLGWPLLVALKRVGLAERISG